MQFYRLLSPVIAEIKCGHTNLIPPVTFFKSQAEENKLIPFDIKLISDRIIVISNYSENVEINKGDEILEINGHSSTTILNELKKYIPSDGFNETAINREIESEFSFYYNLLINDSSSNFNIKLFSYSLKKNYSSTVSGFNKGKFIEKKQKQAQTNTKEKNLSLRINKDSSYALMRCKTFYQIRLKHNGENYKSFLKKSMREIKRNNIQNLIIDIRGNGGGNSEYVHKTLKSFATEPFRQYEKMEVTNDKGFDFLEYTNKRRIYNLVYRHFSKEQNGTYIWKYFRGLKKTHYPSKKAYKGNVYLLCDGATFSAATTLAALAHYHKRATIIGEETGGNYYVINASDFIEVTLPNTKIILRIPVVKITKAVSGFPFIGRGVIPDYPVNYIIQDIMNNEDPVLKQALKVIEKKVN